jgi:peptidoglycan/LPS O-acetylase OafA/YrhL
VNGRVLTAPERTAAAGTTGAAPERWRLGRRPALDGVRGVAVLLVMAQHAELPGFRQGGATGVTMFFALSGFLITALLVEEDRATGRVSLLAFCRRRVGRLLPALVVFLVAVVALGLAPVGDAGIAGLYAANWVRAGGDNLGYLGHTWSLAVEEQFYAVWPLVFVLLRRRPRWLLGLTLLGAVGSAVERQLLWGHGLDRIYFGSDTRADAILLGCALGLVLARGRRIAVPRPVAALAWAGLLGLTAARSGWFFHWGFAPTAFLAVVVVAAAATVRPGATRVLERAPLVRAGRLSYGLYLWQFPIILWLGPRIGSRPVRIVVELGVTVALAVASARYVEQPVRRRIGPRHLG